MVIFTTATYEMKKILRNYQRNQRKRREYKQVCLISIEQGKTKTIVLREMNAIRENLCKTHFLDKLEAGNYEDLKTGKT